MSRDGRASFWLATGVFAVYAAGACPTIYVGDSGELVTATYLLGIPHPSGYPLYVLLGKLWTLLMPVGSIAFRMSLFSAAASAVAVGVLHSLCRRAGLHPVAAAFAALLFAFGATFWAEANVQRVYGLNALFVALATAAAFSWLKDRSRRKLWLAFFLCGLGASNHSFMAVFAIVLGAFVLLRKPRVPGPARLALGAGAAFTAGLLPYAYLPLRSRADPALDWGNPETLRSLLAVVLRWGYWERAWVEGPRDLLLVLGDYARGLAEELLWVGALLALLGVVVGRKRGWPVAFALSIMAANVAAVALHGSRTDIFIWHRYYIPSLMMGSILAGIGCHALLEGLPARLRLLPLAVPAFALVLGWPRFDRSRYQIGEDFGRKLLVGLPPGAHLAASDDNILFVLLYLHWVEGLRPDVDLIQQGVDVDLPPLRFDPDREPLFFTHHPNWSVPGLEILPVGLAFQAVRSGRPATVRLGSGETLTGERDPRVPKDYLTQNLVGHFHYMLGVTNEGTDWPKAYAEFEASAEAAPANDVLFYNLGLIYRRNGLHEEALIAFQRSDAINPRPIPGGSRVRASDRARETAAELHRLQDVEAPLLAALRDQGFRPGTSTFELHLGDLLEERGERSAARGHRLRSQLLE